MARTNTKYSSDKNKRTKLTKKAPGAPKRFCSSYILFFMHHQKHIKAALPNDTEQVRLLECVIIYIHIYIIRQSELFRYFIS